MSGLMEFVEKNRLMVLAAIVVLSVLIYLYIRRKSAAQKKSECDIAGDKPADAADKPADAQDKPSDSAEKSITPPAAPSKPAPAASLSATTTQVATQLASAASSLQQQVPSTPSSS